MKNINNQYEFIVLIVAGLVLVAAQAPLEVTATRGIIVALWGRVREQTIKKVTGLRWLLLLLLIAALAGCDQTAPGSPPALPQLPPRASTALDSATPTASARTPTAPPRPIVSAAPADTATALATPLVIWLPTSTPLPPTAVADTNQPALASSTPGAPVNATVTELDLPASYTVTVNQQLEFTPPGYMDGPLLGVLWVPNNHHYDAGLVMVHGGGLTTGDRLLDRGWGDALAARGFVVLAVDYPLMPAHPFPQAVRAVKTGIEYLRRHAAELGISVNKIALQGYSSGASLAAEAFFTPDQAAYFGTDASVSDRAELLFAYYGAYHLGAGFEPDGPYYVDSEAAAHGDVLQLVANTPGPVYLWHARDDPTVDWTNSRDLAAALEAAGKEAYLYIVDSNRHVFERNGPGIPPGSFNELGKVCLGQELAALVDKLGATKLLPRSRPIDQPPAMNTGFVYRATESYPTIC